MAPIMVCTPKLLPRDQWIQAATKAVEINPLNHAPLERLALVMPGFKLQPEHLAVVVTKYWQTHSVNLTVGFLDNPSAVLRKRILQHIGCSLPCRGRDSFCHQESGTLSCDFPQDTDPAAEGFKVLVDQAPYFERSGHRPGISGLRAETLRGWSWCRESRILGFNFETRGADRTAVASRCRRPGRS